MNKNDLYCAMEKIRPENGKMEEGWEQLSQRIEEPEIHKKRKMPRWGYGVAVVALVCILAVPGTVFADDVKEFFVGILKQENNVAENVAENVYEDSDGHIKIQVLELLSDEVLVQATAKYEALDEEGKAWLKAIDSRQVIPGAVDSLYRSNMMELTTDYWGNTIKYGASGQMGSGNELTDYRTETSRLYFMSCEMVGWSPAMVDCQFRYWLTDGIHETRLDTSANVPVYEYELKAKAGEVLSEYYEPTYIRLSKLSYIVYGYQNGVFDEEWDLTISEEMWEKEFVEKVSFIGKDGNHISGESPTMGFGPSNISETERKKGNGQYDCHIVSGFLENVQYQLFDYGWEEEEKQVDNSEDFTGIVLSNNKGNIVEYEFVKE